MTAPTEAYIMAAAEALCVKLLERRRSGEAGESDIAYTRERGFLLVLFRGPLADEMENAFETGRIAES